MNNFFWIEPEAQDAVRSLSDHDVLPMARDGIALTVSAARAMGHTCSTFEGTRKGGFMRAWLMFCRENWEMGLDYASAALYETIRRKRGMPTHVPAFMEVLQFRLKDSDFKPPGERNAWAQIGKPPCGVPTELRDFNDPVGSYRRYYIQRELSYWRRSVAALTCRQAVLQLYPNSPLKRDVAGDFTLNAVMCRRSVYHQMTLGSRISLYSFKDAPFGRPAWMPPAPLPPLQAVNPAKVKAMADWLRATDAINTISGRNTDWYTDEDVASILFSTVE